MKWLAIVAILSGCIAASGDAGCISYANGRASMPRPVPNDAFGAWFATEIDTRMTATCR